MTQDEEEIMRRNQQLMLAFRDKLCDDDKGRSVFYAILNRCGYFSSDRSLIDPSLIALANWLIQQCGIVSVKDGETNVGDYIKAITGVHPID